MNRFFVILNPASGNGRAHKNWEHTKNKLTSLLQVETAITNQPRDAESIIKKAIESGHRNFIGVGGDGLLQEMANGVLSQTIVDSKDITLALLSQGTGNDWIKTSGMPKDIDKAIARIIEGKTILQDVALVEYNSEKGEQKRRYCINFAGIGFDSYVVQNTLSLKKYGTIAYLLGMLKCLFSYQKPILKITSEEKEITTTAYLCIAGIGKFGGGGMKLMPEAKLDDGLLSVTLAKDFSPFEIIFHILKLYNGDLIKLNKVDSWHTKKITVEIEHAKQEVLLEGDGEIFGNGPFVISVIPKVLKMIV
jgi:YegS/Rv2252/BmrU family lipid kinase